MHFQPHVPLRSLVFSPFCMAKAGNDPDGILCFYKVILRHFMKTAKPGNILYASGMGHADANQAGRMHCKYPKLLKGDISASLTDSPYGINVMPESDGAPWFVAKEICDVLELTNHKVSLHILRSNYEEIEVDTGGVVSTYPIPDSIGRQQNTTIVSKHGMLCSGLLSQPGP